MSKDVSHDKSPGPLRPSPACAFETPPARRCLAGDIPLDRPLDPRPRSARVANDVDSKKKTAKDEGGIVETIKVVVQALLIALVIRTLLFQPFNIPSGSLIPTLLIGDYLFVSKYTYG